MTSLRDFFVPEDVAMPPRSIIEDEDLQVYVRVFGRLSDGRCLVAECDRRIVGDVWTSMMKDYGYFADDTPSCYIALQEISQQGRWYCID